jgi:hypothetical protein
VIDPGSTVNRAQGDGLAMKPPRRRMTTRALIVVTAAFALDFAGIAWVVPQMRLGPRVGNRVLRGDVWVPVNPLVDLIIPVVFLGPILILFALIYLYVPPRLDEFLVVLLILAVLVLLLVPALQHS